MVAVLGILSISIFGLAVFVLLAGPKTNQRTFFALATIFMGFWIGSTAFAYISENPTFWGRSAMASGLMFTGPFTVLSLDFARRLQPLNAKKN